MLTKRWADRSYESVDGGGFKSSGKVPHQHDWVSDGSRLLTGRDFINCGRARIGALPTRSRTTRGRAADRRCRAGCLAQETVNHVLQHCHRTHGARIKRHDAAAAYIERKMPRRGYRVFREPRYNTCIGLRKPDLVGVLGHTAVVVDAQVVSEQTDLDEAHRRKVVYYSEPEVVNAIKERHDVDTVKVTSLTLSWKGVWSPKSAEELRALGLIGTSELKIMATRVLVGSVAGFKIFNATTSVDRRTGIG